MPPQANDLFADAREQLKNALTTPENIPEICAALRGILERAQY